MQLQGNISGSMCQIKTRFCSDCMCSFGYCFHIKHLARIIIYTAKKNKGQFIFMLLNGCKISLFLINTSPSLGSTSIITSSGFNPLCFTWVYNTYWSLGKAFASHKILFRLPFWLIKAYQHQMQVHGKLVHYNHLVRQCTNDF